MVIARSLSVRSLMTQSAFVMDQANLASDRSSIRPNSVRYTQLNNTIDSSKLLLNLIPRQCRVPTPSLLPPRRRMRYPRCTHRGWIERPLLAVRDSPRLLDRSLLHHRHSSPRQSSANSPAKEKSSDSLSAAFLSVDHRAHWLRPLWMTVLQPRRRASVRRKKWRMWMQNKRRGGLI